MSSKLVQLEILLDIGVTRPVEKYSLFQYQEVHGSEYSIHVPQGVWSLCLLLQPQS